MIMSCDISEKPKIGKLHSWPTIKLIDVLETLETGTRPKGGAVGISDGIPSISAEHMTGFGTFDFSTMRFVPEDFYNRMTRGHIQIGDVLIVKDGATTGKTCIVKEDFPFDKAVINEHVFLCRPNKDRILPEYLFYYLWGPYGQASMKSNFQGAAIGGINQTFAQSMWISLPPLSEQKEIVSILDKKLMALERARTASLYRLNLAKELPKIFLRRIFSQDTINKWPLKRLHEVAILLPSKSIATDGDVKVKAITTACLTELGFNAEGIKIARMWSSDASLCTVTKNEVLVARSNTEDLVGRVSIYKGAPPNIIASDLTIRIKVNSDMNPSYLAYFLSFLYQSGYWKTHASGASGSMKKITRHQLNNIKIPVPDNKIQELVATRITQYMDNTLYLIKRIEDELSTISCLPNVIIKNYLE